LISGNKIYIKSVFGFFVAISFLLLNACGSSHYDVGDKEVSDSTKTKDTSKYTSLAYKSYTKKDYRVRTAPEFTLQFNGAFNYGLGELNSNYETIYEVQQFENGQNFAARIGYGAYALGKIPIKNHVNFRITFFAGANFFNNNKFTSKTSNSGSVKYQVFSIGGGFENSFTPSFKVKPYFGASILFNVIMGHAKYVNDDTVSKDITIKPSFRIGALLCVGFEYLISDRTGLNFGINLISANLLLKQSKTSSSDTEIPLRDRRVTFPLFQAGYKQFLFTSFFIGVNFYFGIKERAFRL
jgi:hypothetical protein